MNFCYLCHNKINCKCAICKLYICYDCSNFNGDRDIEGDVCLPCLIEYSAKKIRILHEEIIEEEYRKEKILLNYYLPESII